MMGHQIRTFQCRWRRPRRALMGEDELFRCEKTHNRVLHEGNIGSLTIGRKTPGKHTVVTGLWLWLMEGSSSNNCKQTAEAERVVLQGYPHLHETLSRHLRRIYGFYSGRLLLNKCNAMSAKCCANLKLTSSTCKIGFLPEPYCLLNTFP